MPKQKRDKVFIWPSWVSKLVAGEEQCYWKYWIKAHYTFDKLPNDFNLAKWTIQHNQLLHQRRDALEKLGFKVSIEDQNSFKLDVLLNKNVVGNLINPLDSQAITIIISGKADIIAIGEEESLSGEIEHIYLVEDCKTGNPKTSDHVQVMLYMLLLPKAIEKYKNVEFDGCIVYKLGIPNIDIPAEAAQDESLKKIIWDTIKQIAGDEVNCRKVPSRKECNRCDISKEFCNERIE